MSTVAYIVLTAGALAGLATFLVAHYIDRRRWHEWRRRIALNERTRWYSRNPWAGYSLNEPGFQRAALWVAIRSMTTTSASIVEAHGRLAGQARGASKAVGYLRRRLPLEER